MAAATGNSTATAVLPSYHICLVGSGGVGTIASLVLSKSNLAHVTAVLRSKFRYVSEHGWQVDSIDHGKLEGWKPHRVVGTVEDAAVEETEMEADERSKKHIRYDYVVVCTKQLPSHNPVAEMIAPVVTAGHTSVVLIQNGIGIEEEIIAAWPGNVVISSVSHIGSSIEAPNKVRQIGKDVSKMGAHLHAGVPDERSHQTARDFVKLYCAGGASECEFVDDIQTARWEKLLWNSTFNPVCALTHSDVSQIQRSRGRETLLLPMMWEIWHTAKAAGHPMPDSIVSWMAYRLSDDLAYRPSMLLDLEAGRPMELDVILGNPRRIAESLGVATPVLDTVHKLLQVEQWKIDQAQEQEQSSGKR